MAEFVKQADGTFVTVVKVMGEPDSNGRVWDPVAMEKAVEAFNVRVKRGVAHGELGQPSRYAGQTQEQFEQRAGMVEQGNVCCDISDVRIEGNKLMAAMKPSGRWQGSLEQMLSDGVPLSMGIRAFADSLPGGEMKIRNIVTFDVIDSRDDQ